MLTFHDPIPNVEQQVGNALLAQEYWYRDELISNANVLFLRLENPAWHRLFVDAGVVFWKTVEVPDAPTGDRDHSYRHADIAGLHGLTGKRLSVIKAIDLPGGGTLRLGFEGGTAVTLHNTKDSSDRRRALRLAGHLDGHRLR
jgi:hypothetical protein